MAIDERIDAARSLFGPRCARQVEKLQHQLGAEAAYLRVGGAAFEPSCGYDGGPPGYVEPAPFMAGGIAPSLRLTNQATKAVPRSRDSRRRRHTTMVTTSEFREIVTGRAEGRELRFAATAKEAGKAEPRRVSVLLSDDEVELLQRSRRGLVYLVS